jgi:hypothetical protein
MTASADFQHAVVRDLAELLLGAAPWHTGCEIPRERLLGAHGLALLHQLDRDPAPLLAILAQRPACRRLGRYVEALLWAWCQLAPHCSELHANLPVRDGGRTLGEFDLLLRLDGEPWHVEVACKYYLVVGRQAVGADLHDAWLRKFAKLEQQLRLSRHPLAQAVLPAGWQNCQVGSLLRGRFFHRDAPVTPAPLNPLAPAGWWRPLAEPWPGEQDASVRYMHLPRLRWLGSACGGQTGGDSAASLRAQLADYDSPQQIAVLQQNGDGVWQEAGRGFIVPGSWLESDMLTLAEA